MTEIIGGNILSTNFFSFTPIARAAGNGVFVSAEASALGFASDNAGRNSASFARGSSRIQPQFIAFDPSGRLVGSQVSQIRGVLIDITA
tara:strand:- start:900 stop:1166 length:267 start_codon:yes stop_codon:yes gene_type:complete